MSRKKVSIRPRDGGNSAVSLFPFLAVLLCTMGALIMLLVVIARNVREQDDETLEIAAVVRTENEKIETTPVGPAPDETVSDETASVEDAPPEDRLTEEQAREILETIQMNAEEADWFAENLAKSKAEAEEKFDEAKAWLAAAEKQSQKLKDEIERLTQLAGQLDPENPAAKDSAQNVENLKALLELRQGQIKELESALEKLQKEAEKDAKSYAIVPYRGKNGTFRRPIYIECVGDKVIIQPEGVVLTANDFAVDRPDNPMDVAMRVVRQYYVETEQIARGTEPYPLVIVRPSGVEAYNAAMRSMGNWVREFGYELVDEDWKIEYHEPSDELRQRIEKQVATARHRMQGYAIAMREQGLAANRSSRQYRVDSRGRVEAIDEPFTVRENPGRSSGAPRQGNPAEGQAGGIGSTPGSSPVPGYGNENSVVDGVYRPNGSANQGRYAPGTMPGTGQGAATNSVSGFHQNGTQGSNDGISGPVSPGGASTFAGVRPGAASPDISLNSQDPSAAGMYEELLPGQPMPESLAAELAARQSANSGQRNAEQGRSDQGNSDFITAPGYAHTGAFTAPNSVSNPNAGTPGSAIPMPRDVQIAAGQSAAQAGTNVAQQNGQYAQGGDPNSTAPGQAEGSCPATPGVPSPFAAALTPSASGIPMAELSASTNPQAASPQPTSATQYRPTRQAPSKKQDRPDNWALRDVKPFSAAVKRNIKIQCEADKFVLVQQKGLTGIRVVPIADSVIDSTEKLVQHIGEFMDSWGMAGEKYFWQPVLQVKVQPGGEIRFRELQYLLQNSGIVIEQVQ